MLFEWKKIIELNSYTKSALCNGRGHSWQGLEGIAFTGKVLKDRGQCVAQICLGFDTVMEDDDGSGTGMLNHILGATLWSDVTVKITAEDIPHDDAVVPLEKLHLAWFQFSVGRAEETGVNHPGAMAYVMEIGDIFSSPAGEMIHGMIADGVAGINDHVVDIRVLPDIVSDTKESAFGIVTRQYIQNPGGHFRNRTIIKSEVDFFSVRGHFPDKPRKECLNILRRVY